MLSQVLTVVAIFFLSTTTNVLSTSLAQRDSPTNPSHRTDQFEIHESKLLDSRGLLNSKPTGKIDEQTQNESGLKSQRKKPKKPSSAFFAGGNAIRCENKQPLEAQNTVGGKTVLCTTFLSQGRKSARSCKKKHAGGSYLCVQKGQAKCYVSLIAPSLSKVWERSHCRLCANVVGTGYLQCTRLSRL